MEQSEEGSGPPSAPPHPRSPPPAPLSPVAKLEQYKSERAQCVHGDDGAIIIASDEVKTKPAVGVAFFSNSPKDAALGGAVRLTELIEGYVASPDFVGIQSNNVLKHQFSSIQAVSARLSEHVVEKLLHNKEVRGARCRNRATRV